MLASARKLQCLVPVFILLQLNGISYEINSSLIIIIYQFFTLRLLSSLKFKKTKLLILLEKDDWEENFGIIRQKRDNIIIYIDNNIRYIII